MCGEDGKVKRSKKDYADKKGLTQRPIVNENLNKVSPLHSMMRVFEFCITLLYHLRSGTFQWTESSLKLGESYQVFSDAKDQVKRYGKSKTGINMDAADSTGKGGNTKMYAPAFLKIIVLFW